MADENQNHDWQAAERDPLDRDLDAALAKYAAVEPRAGLEDRVLANLRAERGQRSGSRVVALGSCVGGRSRGGGDGGDSGLAIQYAAPSGNRGPSCNRNSESGAAWAESSVEWS